MSCDIFSHFLRSFKLPSNQMIPQNKIIVYKGTKKRGNNKPKMNKGS